MKENYEKMSSRLFNALSNGFYGEKLPKKKWDEISEEERVKAQQYSDSMMTLENLATVESSRFWNMRGVGKKGIKELYDLFEKHKIQRTHQEDGKGFIYLPIKNKP